MHTVPLSRDNIGPAAWVAQAAYRDSNFVRWLKPYPSTFPDHAAHFFSRRLRGSLATSDHHIRVMVTDDSDAEKLQAPAAAAAATTASAAQTPSSLLSSSSSSPPPRSLPPEGTVVGVAVWKRVFGKIELERQRQADDGGGRKAAMLRDHWSQRDGSWWWAFERWAVDRAEAYHSFMGTDPSYSREARRTLIATMRNVQKKLAELLDNYEPSGGGYIYLSDIVVDPSFQGMGAGKRLVKQGTDMADREGVPVTLVATEAGERVYAKAGFVKVGQDNVRGDHDHAIMMYWPKGLPPAKIKKFVIDSNGARDVEE